MLAQPTEDEGATSERPSEPQPTPSPPHPSEANVEPQTDPSHRPSPFTHIPDSIPESSGGNHGGQSSSDKSLSGNKGDMTLQSVYDLCISLCTQVTDQAKEIKHLKAQIKKLKKAGLLLILSDYFRFHNDLESDDGSVDTPLVSSFLDSDDESDDVEVLNELDEYGNEGNFYRSLFPFLPMNIITRKAYNTIMAEGLKSTGKNFVAIVRDVYVFVGSFTYVTDFVVLEDIWEFIVIFDEEKPEIS
ncbi:hypothetical protein Tco_0453354 [Tanacetum coccineum]